MHQRALAPILADPRVGATMGGVASAAEVAERLASSAEEWDRDGFGYWMFFDAVSGEPLARDGLRRSSTDSPRSIYGDHVLYRRRS